MEKVINLNDKISQEDQMLLSMVDFSQPKGTQVIIKDDNGNILWEGHNKTVIAGSQFIATSLWDIEPIVKLPNYNSELGIPNISRNPDDPKPTICLFCVGISGCGSQNSQVYPVTYTNRIAPTSLIPFRYEKGTDLPDEARSIYYGRLHKEGISPELDRYAYYYKAIESKQLHMEYVDGTEITSTVYSNPSTTKAITYMEAALTISKSDCRDIFSSGDFTPTLADGTISPPLTLADARVNTLSLLSAWYKVGKPDEIKEYMDVQPVTQINFSNVSLVDSSTQISILYRTFY